MYSYSLELAVPVEATYTEGVVLSLETFSPTPVLSLLVNLISLISTPTFLAENTPTAIEPSSCTLSAARLSYLSSSPLLIDIHASFVFFNVNVYVSPSVKLLLVFLKLCCSVVLVTSSKLDVSIEL